MKRRVAGIMKRWIMEISEEMGFDGLINKEVLAEGQRRLDIVEKEERRKERQQRKARLIKIARALVARKSGAPRGKRHKPATAKGRAKYRKMKTKGGTGFKRNRSKYIKKWRKGKGRSAPSQR